MAVKSVLVIGGKLLGLSSAIEIKRRFPEIEVTLIETEPFLTADNHILDKSATLSCTKTLHSGTYYTHRGHSRGYDPNETHLLRTLTEETSRDYFLMMQLLKEYDIAPHERDSKTLYMMFNNAFVEPEHFETITKESGIWLEKVPGEEFERLKNIFLEYDSYSVGPLVLEGAFYTK